MHIERLEPTENNAAIWDAFVDRHPDATSDHWWGWRRVLSGAFGFEPHYLAAFNDQQQLAGILPLFKIPRGFGRCALSSIPYGNYGGIAPTRPRPLTRCWMRQQLSRKKHMRAMSTCGTANPCRIRACSANGFTAGLPCHSPAT